MNIKFYGRRLIAALIDMYFVGFFITIPNFIFWEKALKNNWNLVNYSIIYQIIAMFIFVLYWYISEKYFHTTIGKKLMKLKVRGGDKENYFIRSICKFLPLDIISFLFTKDGRFWHDIYSNTDVIEKKSNNNLIC